MIANLFYNVSFNYTKNNGVSKFMWGVMDLDLTKDLKTQILNGSDFDISLVYNFQINALNPVSGGSNANNTN